MPTQKTGREERAQPFGSSFYMFFPPPGPAVCKLGQPGVLFVPPEVLTPVLGPFFLLFLRAFPFLVFQLLPFWTPVSYSNYPTFPQALLGWQKNCKLSLTVQCEHECNLACLSAPICKEGGRLKSIHDIKVEGHVLFGGNFQDLKPGRQPLKGPRENCSKGGEGRSQVVWKFLNIGQVVWTLKAFFM